LNFIDPTNDLANYYNGDLPELEELIVSYLLKLYLEYIF